MPGSIGEAASALCAHAQDASGDAAVRDSVDEDDRLNDARRRSIAAVVVVAAVVVLSVNGLREHFEQGTGVTDAGKRHAMADVALTEIDGGTWRLQDHRGEVVAINLWATWCGPCQEETPAMVRTARDLGPKGFAVVGVSLDQGDREGKVRAFAKRYDVNYPMTFPDSLSQMSAGLEGIPTTLLIDRGGRVAKTYIGEVREKVLRMDVTTLLAE